MYKIYVYIDNDIDHIYIYVFEKQIFSNDSQARVKVLNF